MEGDLQIAPKKKESKKLIFNRIKFEKYLI